MKIIISGGGTGGHIFPAIAIADALKAAHPTIDILFVGANGKMEMERVPKAGYPIKGLNIAGFHRKQTLRNLTFPFKLMASMWSAIRIVQQFKPDAVIGVGGYASGPTLKAAAWLGIPTFLQEQNSFAGVTNKLLAKSAKKIFVAYKGMDKFFEKDKIDLVGNPVRSAVFQHSLNRNTARRKLDVPINKKVVLISGGSLGARAINNAIAANEDRIRANQDVYYYWQVGKLYYDEFSKKEIAQLSNVKVVAFIEDMAAAYEMADVVVSRAGALTISELTLVGKPSILIPSPNVAEDHQTHNAMALVDEGAAILIKDKEASSILIDEIEGLIEDEDRKAKLSIEIKKLGKRNAATEISQSILKEIAR